MPMQQCVLSVRHRIGGWPETKVQALKCSTGAVLTNTTALTNMAVV
jgi:hypothetical protein